MFHKLIVLRRISVQGFHNFFRNAWLSTAATAIMVVTLSIILSALVINLALSDTIDDIASRVTVSIFLNDDVEQARLDEFKTVLESNPNVESVDFVDKNDALAIYQETFGDSPELITGTQIVGNQLPASYEVNLIDLSQIDSVTEVANQQDYSDIVDETSVNEKSREAIDNIAKAQDFITLTSIIAASIFAIISILVIFNTIRMAIFTRATEIEIMKLIGATPGYIRAPFLFESALYGVVAGILAGVAIYSMLLGLGPRVNNQLLIDPTIDLFVDNWLSIMLITIITGILIGLISSFASLSRYLRLKHW